MRVVLTSPLAVETVLPFSDTGIRIFSLNQKEKCWFDIKKTYGKYKGTTITKACVSQLAWNKEGREVLAIGTSSGLVLAYQAE